MITFFGFTKDNPFDNPYEVKAAFKQTSTTLKPKLARAHRRRQRRQGQDGRAAAERRAAAIVDDGDQGRGAAAAPRRDGQGAPAHLPRGQLLRRHPARARRRRRSLDERRDDPASQNTAAPVQFGQVLEALQSDTREDLRDRPAASTARRCRAGRPRLQPLASSTGSRRSENSAIVNDATRGVQRARPVGLPRAARGRSAEGLDRNPERCKSLITDLAAPRARSRASRPTSPRRSTSCRARSTAAAARWPSSTRRSRRCARSRRELTPAVRTSPAPRSTPTLPLVRQMRGLVSPAELRRPGRATSASRLPALVALNRGGVEPAGPAAAARQLPEHVADPLDRWRRSTTRTSRPRAPSTRRRQVVAGRRGRRAAASTATASTSRSFAPIANFAYPLGRPLLLHHAAAAAASTRAPARAAPVPPDGPVRDPGAAGPARRRRCRRRQVRSTTASRSPNASRATLPLEEGDPRSPGATSSLRGCEGLRDSSPSRRA